MSKADKYFIETIKQIFEEDNNTFGKKVRPKYEDGTPAHTLYLTNKVYEYDLSKGEFPLLTLRNTAWKSAIKEVLWIYQDQTSDLSVLKEKYDIHWWDSWGIGDGTIGKRYGETVGSRKLIDKLIRGLKEDKYSRRHIINMYQYDDFNETDGLHPCAYETIWNVRGKYLDLLLVQRSSDMGVALSINECQYVALQMMMAKACGYEIGKFTHVIGNIHIYDRHFDNIEKLINKEPTNEKPIMILDTDKTDFYSFTIDDFKVMDYTPHRDKYKFELGI